MYLNEIVVFLKNSNNKMAHLQQVLALLRDVGFTLKLKNCSFFSAFIDYLGHVIRQGRLGLSEVTSISVRKLKDPTIMTGLIPFLGLCNVFYRFVPNFSKVAT